MKLKNIFQRSFYNIKFRLSRSSTVVHRYQEYTSSITPIPSQDHFRDVSWIETTMRVLYALPLIISSALAAPAIIWKQASKVTAHSNVEIEASKLIKDVVSGSKKDTLSSVIFLIGRDVDGKEALASIGQSGKLPLTKEKYGDAEIVHYNVANLESHHTVLRDAKKALDKTASVLTVSLSELQSKLDPQDIDIDEISSKSQRKRTKAIQNASVLIVHVDTNEDMSSLDSAISSSIAKADSTIVASIRSTQEVKHARKLMSKQSSTQRQRRRLEEGGDDDANNDYSGVYYVNMTPNIFAGLLFTFFFLFVTYLGVACMSMIQGQDVYVDKMPSIGREA